MITLTPTAASNLQDVLHSKGLSEAPLGLRVFVQGGGCGGMQYGMTFEGNPREVDEVYETYGIKVFVDPTSMFYVNGAQIDFVDNLMGGGFHIENPNAVSSCGCGSSFRTAQTHSGEEPASCGHN